MATARELAERDPANAEWQRDRAVAELKVGRAQVFLGKIGDARASVARALALRESLAARDADNLRWQADLADDLAVLADIHARQGALDESLALLERALAINRALAERQPDHPEWQESLAARHRSLCERRAAAGGNGKKAIADCHRAVVLMQRLTADEPGAVARQWQLARSHAALAEQQLSSGAAAEASAHFATARDRLAALVAAEPRRSDIEQDLGTVQHSLGDALFALEDFESGLRAYQAALRTSIRLAEQHPENPEIQRALAIAYEKAADIAIRAMGKLDGAMALYRRSFKIYHAARRRDPGDLRNLMDMSIVITRMGELFWRQAAFEKGLQAYRDALALRRQLVDADAANTGWRHALAESHARLGTALLKQERSADALAHFEHARDHYAALVAAGGARHAVSLARATEQIGNAHMRHGDATSASNAYAGLEAQIGTLASGEPNDPQWVIALERAHRLRAAALLAGGDPGAAHDHLAAGIVLLVDAGERFADKRAWRRAIANAATHAGSVLGGQHGIDDAVIAALLEQARARFSEMASSAPLDEDERKQLAEIERLLAGDAAAVQ